MAQSAIIAQDLTFSYGKQIAVDGISFEVEEGEVFGFLGPNGAGKTTAVRILTGQLQPQRGSAIVLGKDMRQYAKQVQQFLGISFENANLYEEMSAVENLQLFARLFGLRQFDAMELLEKVGLKGREKERVANYSKGMKQRLMLARALINQPRVLFLDEPTDGLDPVSSQTIHTIIHEAAERGCAVFLTTHDMMEADKLSHRVAFINQGKIAALDRPAVLKQRFGKRSLKVETVGDDGQTQTHNIALDDGNVSLELQNVLASGKILTAHTEEATLEDIFIQMTGRRLLA